MTKTVHKTLPGEGEGGGGQGVGLVGDGGQGVMGSGWSQGVWESGG